MRRDGEPTAGRRAFAPLAIVFRLAIAACFVLSLAALVPRFTYLARLAAAPGAQARGALAADERLSPLAAAGQVQWRRELAERALKDRTESSGLALAWTFFVEEGSRVPAGSRVLLARPNDALYQFGNFLWFPARLEVAPDVAMPLADGDDLRRAAVRRPCADREWLRANGYAGCVDAVGARWRLHLVDEGEAP